jgi:hypothetical protein
MEKLLAVFPSVDTSAVRYRAMSLTGTGVPLGNHDAQPGARAGSHVAQPGNDGALRIQAPTGNLTKFEHVVFNDTPGVRSWSPPG